MENFRTLAERMEFARTRAGLSQLELARRTGVKQPTISNIEKGDIKSITRGAKIAAELGVRALWLEEGIGPMELSEASANNESDTFYIPQYDVSGSMGNGFAIGQSVGVIHSFTVNSEWLRENLNGRKSTKGICIVTGFGDSMEPLFRSGDPLLVDTNIQEYIGEFPYFFRIENDGFIKRLMKVPGIGFRVISENKIYDPWDIRPDMDFAILGKVIKAWCSTDF